MTRTPAASQPVSAYAQAVGTVLRQTRQERGWTRQQYLRPDRVDRRSDQRGAADVRLVPRRSDEPLRNVTLGPVRRPELWCVPAKPAPAVRHLRRTPQAPSCLLPSPKKTHVPASL